MFSFKRDISERCPRFFSAFFSFFKGDACTSCQSPGAAVGDGVAVPGPKGERGDPGPPGEGKPGKNVRKLHVCPFIHLFFCAMHKKNNDNLVFFSGEARLSRCAGTRRSQRKQGAILVFFPTLVYKYTQSFLSTHVTLTDPHLCCFSFCREKLEQQESAFRGHK